MATLNVGGSAASVAQALDIISGLGLVGVPTISGTWANRATYLAAGHTTVFFTDIGVGGTVYRYNTRWRPLYGRYLNSNLVSSTTHALNTRAVMGYSGFLPGQVQDGDFIDVEWYKTMTGATGAETDTTESAAGTANTTFGTALNLSTAALTNSAPAVGTVRWRWKRINSTTLRPVSVGSVAGTAGTAPADQTAVPDMDTLTWYLQISGILTSGAVSATSALRQFNVWHTAGS